jgi:LPXTG-motif cell wall-anchored protein
MSAEQIFSKRAAWRATALGGAVTAAAVSLAVFAPTASAGTVSVGYGSCTSSNTQLTPPPPDYTSQVTLTPQGSSFQVGKAITITWHYSTSTAPAPGIPLANVATAKAKIVIGGAGSSTISTGSSANFPPAPVATGGTFQIPDMTATFTPTAAGKYTLTPGDNEQDIAQFGLVVACKASASGPAATITVAPASGGGSSSSSPSTSGHSSSSSRSSSASSSKSSSGSSGSSGTSASSTSATGTEGSSTAGGQGATAGSTSSSTAGELPHTGFDGRWLFGGAVLAAVLGGGGLYATRRRPGSHG